ncbi:UDP-N-acetylmuramyl pentapeptide phosphotransferase/UDP-N-acetylglucosamine-1-phosphate transferase [Gulbenkiania indica]|uniref:UDP-N-acetylmuramyl pentapeptide phosphotransferase/UDP-N-acetylglucosamine-1-phosphate transferase n=1 Tax=Gulbenkiania indica TaxID=375574 RepID=A0A0K6GSL6_9NEIS|nr:glycosyltransferase [Gulbenkiania indica]CUA81710.1 UDP-N-acetylmuramyl pentapeptide phosphotransferase/UDP-N-acetylglucosamine-1-phosphate transferase [Gulbenkiania indica]
MLLAILIITFVIALVVCMFCIRLVRYTGLDPVQRGPQKFHVRPTGRIGGVGILSGLLGAVELLHVAEAPIDAALLSLLMLAAAPVFLAGLVEDLTRKVSPRFRLAGAFASALLASLLMGAVVPSFGLPGLDWLLAGSPLLALTCTMFAVGGVCHAFNIIDGYNGVLGGSALFVAAALAYVAYKTGQQGVLVASVALMGSLLGFLVWNFPAGLLFAGDGGAYLVGFLLAEMSVLLVEGGRGAVSPWFPMLLMIYPVFETLFSIYRKKHLRKMSPGVPDGLHFHMLVYKRLVRWMVGSDDVAAKIRRNSLTAPYLWAVTLSAVLPALLFWQSERLLQGACLAFVLFYLWTYTRIVRFRVPRWWVLRKRG